MFYRRISILYGLLQKEIISTIAKSQALNQVNSLQFAFMSFIQMTNTARDRTSLSKESDFLKPAEEMVTVLLKQCT